MHRGHGIGDRRGTETARAEMDINYFGLLRLAQSFGPALRARAAEGSVPSTAWINILSIYALSALPGQGTFSASKAAAFSLSQTLRAEMRGAGIRVVNVFPGPVDDEWTQLVPPPKLAPAALAKAVVKALKDGVEDIYPGDVAQDLFMKWRESAKVLEREMWDQ
jgi:NAD(P)-dependent dehydrogenase (short-subunit alcohol dehydrogenase family)